MEFQIREIETGHDIMEVNRLAGIVWRETYRTLLTREQIAYMIEKYQSVRALTEQLAFGGYRYFLLEEAAEAVGYCGVQMQEGKLFLSKMYLMARAQGKGYFRQMLERLEQLCRENGATAIWLTVNRYNDRAIGAYRNGRLCSRTPRCRVVGIGPADGTACGSACRKIFENLSA